MPAIVNVVPRPGGVIVRIHETGAGASSEVQIPFHSKYGTIVSVRSQRTLGTGSMVQPSLGSRPSWAAGTLAEVYRAPHAAGSVRDVRRVPFLAPDGVLWFRSNVNAGTDNTITTEIDIEHGLIDPLPKPRKIPHVGRVAEAVEGEGGSDPSGLLVSAVDTADGGITVQLGTGAGTATPNPSVALGWSVPLRDIVGDRILSFGNFLADGNIRIHVLSAPTAFSAPSNMYAWAAVLPDGPLGTATKGFGGIIRNTSAGLWIVGHVRLASGTWTVEPAGAGNANTTGVHAAYGSPNLGGGSTSVITAANLPIPTTAHSRRDFTSISLTGNDPHFAFGFGWADTPAGADSMTARFEAQYSAP